MVLGNYDLSQLSRGKKMRKFINKIVDVPRLILTIWCILWAILILLLIMKFCFGIWYPIICDNDLFVKICNFIDNNKIIRFVIMFLFYIMNSYLILFIITKTKRFHKWYLHLICLSIFGLMFFLKTIRNEIGVFCEICIVIVSIVINYKTNKFSKQIINISFPIAFYLIINLWQLSIYLVRGLKIEELNSYSVLISYILQLDYYVFLFISWIGVSFMGLYGWGWLWGKDVTTLKAEKEKELAKEKPNVELIAKIDKNIAKLEKHAN